MDEEDLQPEWHEAEGDRRTPTQLDYDTFMSIFRAGLRAEEEGAGGSLKTPHEVITHIDVRGLAERQGQGYPEGGLARISLPTVERLVCSGGTRLFVHGEGGSRCGPAGRSGSAHAAGSDAAQRRGGRAVGIHVGAEEGDRRLRRGLRLARLHRTRRLVRRAPRQVARP